MDRNARRIGIGFQEAFNPETQKLARKEAEAKAKDEASAVCKANRERIQAERRKQEETENTKAFGEESLMESPPLYSVLNQAVVSTPQSGIEHWTRRIKQRKNASPW